jgi:hypothetical protein
MKRLIKKSDEFFLPKDRFIPLLPQKKVNQEEVKGIELLNKSNRKITFKYNYGAQAFDIPEDLSINKRNIKIFVNGLFLWDNDILTKINQTKNIVNQVIINFNLNKDDIVEFQW